MSAPRVVEPASEAMVLRLRASASLQGGAQLGEARGRVLDRKGVEEGVAEVGLELVGSQLAAKANRCGGLEGRCSAADCQGRDKPVRVVVCDAASAEADHDIEPNTSARSMARLRHVFADATGLLLNEHAAELGEPFGAVDEDGEDLVTFGDRERALSPCSSASSAASRGGW